MLYNVATVKLSFICGHPDGLKGSSLSCSVIFYSAEVMLIWEPN